MQVGSAIAAIVAIAAVAVVAAVAVIAVIAAIASIAAIACIFGFLLSERTSRLSLVIFSVLGLVQDL